MQSVAMRIIYKGVFHWFLKLIVGVQFTDCQLPQKGEAVYHPCQS